MILNEENQPTKSNNEGYDLIYSLREKAKRPLKELASKQFLKTAKIQNTFATPQKAFVQHTNPYFKQTFHTKIPDPLQTKASKTKEWRSFFHFWRKGEKREK